MIQERDSDDGSRCLKLGGYLDVVGRWFEAATWMIVGNDDRRGAIGQRVREYFARMNWRSVDKADGNDSDVQNLVGSVDACAKEMLLFPVGVVSHVRQQVGGRFDLGSLRFEPPRHARSGSSRASTPTPRSADR